MRTGLYQGRFATFLLRGLNKVDKQKLFTVGDVAKRSGLSVYQIRNYVDLGLVEPCERSAAGHRLFNSESINRFTSIRAALDIGFSMREIINLFRAMASGDEQDVRKEADKVYSDLLGKQKKLQALESLVHKILSRSRDDES